MKEKIIIVFFSTYMLWPTLAYAGQWTPSLIDTTLWLDATDSSTIWEDTAGTISATSDVRRWDDKSGNDYDVTTPGGISPMKTGQFTINSLNTISNTTGGTARPHLSNTSVTIPNNHMVFLLSYIDQASFSQGPFQILGTDRYGFYRGMSEIRSTGNAGANLTGLGDTLDVTTIYSAVFNATSGTKTAYKTGVSLGSNAYTSISASSAPQAVHINRNADQSPNARHGEVIIVPNDTSDTTRQIIEGYLAHRWGIQGSLSVGHPYKSSAPASDISSTKAVEDINGGIVEESDTLEYTIIIENSGNVQEDDISIDDTIDPNTQLDTGSFTYSNCGSPDDSESSTTTVDIDDVDVSTTNNCVITYQVTIPSALALNQEITNSVSVNIPSEGTEVASSPAVYFAGTINAGVPAKGPDLTGSTIVVSDVNGGELKPLDVLRYTLTINTTQSDATNIDALDTIDTNTSLRLNRVSTNDQCGTFANNSTKQILYLEDVDVVMGTSCIISYEVIVDDELSIDTTLTNDLSLGIADEGGFETELSVDATINSIGRLVVNIASSSSTNVNSNSSLIGMIQLLIQLQKNLSERIASLDECALKEISDMEFGLQNMNVSILQNFLIKRGYSIPAGATGYFGFQTQAALIQYQKDNDISQAVGYFGSITKNSIVCDPTGNRTPILSLRSSRPNR